jgi:hypothetical protein
MRVASTHSAVPYAALQAQEENKKYLTEEIEKLERALELNQDSRTHDGELAVFSLGNALYFEFFLEKNDSKAEKSLEAAKLKFEVLLSANKIFTLLMIQAVACKN